MSFYDDDPEPEIIGKPCPCCGGTGLYTTIDEDTDDWLVLCNGCDVRGPTGVTEREAIRWWNHFRANVLDEIGGEK